MVWMFVLVSSVLVMISLAMTDMRKPVTLGQAIRSEGKSVATTTLIGCAVTFGMYLAIAGIIDRNEAKGSSELEFATGMTQALERVAYLKGGNPALAQEWSGQDHDGSRYAILRDDAGPFVRAENVSSRACMAALNYLSPYAASVLVMRDERGMARMDARTRACPEGDGRLQAVFRAPS